MTDFDSPDIWTDPESESPQMRCYRTMTPRQYAHTADLVDICMRISYRPCTGNGCDEDRACGRHGRATRVADRYHALVKLWGRR